MFYLRSREKLGDTAKSQEEFEEWVDVMNQTDFQLVQIVLITLKLFTIRLLTMYLYYTALVHLEDQDTMWLNKAV